MMFRATRCRVVRGPGKPRLNLHGCMHVYIYIYIYIYMRGICMEGCARACGCGIHGDLVTQHDANWIFKAFI